jgi:hypothetical protein
MTAYYERYWSEPAGDLLIHHALDMPRLSASALLASPWKVTAPHEREPALNARTAITVASKAQRICPWCGKASHATRAAASWWA